MLNSEGSHLVIERAIFMPTRHIFWTPTLQQKARRSTYSMVHQSTTWTLQDSLTALMLTKIQASKGTKNKHHYCTCRYFMWLFSFRRQTDFAQSRLVTLFFPLLCDIFQQKRLLPPHLDVKVALTPSSSSFRIRSGVPAPNKNQKCVFGLCHIGKHHT